MGLDGYRVTASIAVSDMGKAKEFYEGKLGLSGGQEEPDGGVDYTCGKDSVVHVYPSPDNAGTSGATIAFWEVDDTEKVVDELSSNGITFEQYDSDPIKTNEKGIAELGGDKAAWFKDPDGNILAVGEED
jgi:catechol 2,3-dioxygenase-like lactoylglutathione lyase family enzyme